MFALEEQLPVATSQSSPCTQRAEGLLANVLRLGRGKAEGGNLDSPIAYSKCIAEDTLICAACTPDTGKHGPSYHTVSEMEAGD